MFKDNTDESWEKIGKNDPYYGVLTFDKYRTNNLDASGRIGFFESGTQHMVELVERVECNFGKLSKNTAVDFGCGVGRLALPLAKDIGFSRVVCVDISQSMLAEAKKSAGEFGINNIEFVVADDSLAGLKEEYDFIHSFIVFQHIPVKRGEMIIKHLINRLSSGGVAALQMPFSRKVGWLRKLANFIRVHIRPLHVIANILQSRPWNEPPMQMNRYNINTVLRIVFECGISDVKIKLLNEGGNIGAYLFVQK